MARVCAGLEVEQLLLSIQKARAADKAPYQPPGCNRLELH